MLPEELNMDNLQESQGCYKSCLPVARPCFLSGLNQYLLTVVGIPESRKNHWELLMIKKKSIKNIFDLGVCLGVGRSVWYRHKICTFSEPIQFLMVPRSFHPSH